MGVRCLRGSASRSRWRDAQGLRSGRSSREHATGCHAVATCLACGGAVRRERHPALDALPSRICRGCWIGAHLDGWDAPDR